MLPQLYKCFQHWSADGSVYIYSDPHFEDSDCKTMDATWPAPAEQIAKINAKVHKGDTLIILGDIGNSEWIKQIKAGYKVLIAGNHDVGLTNYKKTITHEIKEIFTEYVDDEEKYEIDVAIERKSFHKYLYEKYPYAKINIQERYEFHSPFHFFDATIDDNLFDEVYGGPLFIGEKILLSHEPIDIPFGLCIHGHCHSAKGLYDGGNKFNVCSNTIGFEPINLGKIIEYGYLKRVNDIHRITIDKASENPIHGRSKAAPNEV